ncbi:hypothetical protein RND71_016338 [Anisodus tanguticus]|uniref:Pentatricopeptide repeat-containing protein n=1 Tax=Anisodus tanguticus TaxID=243964 RepID=A0AAE1S7L2_9SOLA|nr:hypothetical protein RND71_016338 [Anisodus tanguticus]
MGTPHSKELRIKLAHISDTYIATAILKRYTKCRKISTALNLFDEIPHRDTTSWNIMISGYVNSGKLHSAWVFPILMKEHGLGRHYSLCGKAKESEFRTTTKTVSFLREKGES